MLDMQGTGTAAITANKVNGNIVLGNDSAKVNLTLTGADTSWAGNSSGGSTTDFTKGTHVNLNTWEKGFSEKKYEYSDQYGLYEL